MWPAKPDAHGVPFEPNDPSVFAQYTDGMVPMWETYKTAFDLYTGDPNIEPVAWDSPNKPTVCMSDVAPGFTAVVPRLSRRVAPQANNLPSVPKPGSSHSP
jgi:hypothetical protein